MRLYGDRLYFAPCLPAAWTHFRLNLRWREARIEVTVRRDAAEYRLAEGTRARFFHHGLAVGLSTDQPCARLPLAATPAPSTEPTPAPCADPAPAAPSSSISTAS
jgi:alpha,alpha-trehalose phosphorylase